MLLQVDLWGKSKNYIDSNDVGESSISIKNSVRSRNRSVSREFTNLIIEFFSFLINNH